ncbi:MAG: anti-sigma factor [Planctomycetota bacterium]
MNFDTQCPDLSLLLDHRDGILDAAASACVRAHLESHCARCEEELRLLSVATRARGVRFEPVPESLMSRLLTIPQRYARVPSHLPEDIVADLIFDSKEAPELVGVRRTSIAPTRRFEYQAGSWRIELEIESSGPRSHVLIGQISEVDCDPAATAIQVRAMLDGRELDCESIDEFGQFSLRLNDTHRVELEFTPTGSPKIRIALPG